MRRLRSMGLQRRITLLVLVGMLGVVAVFAIYGTLAAQTVTDHELEDRLLTARLAAAHMDHLLTDGQDQLEKLAEQGVMDFRDGNLDLEKALLHDAYRHSTLFSYGFFLVDRSGDLIWREPAGLPDPGSQLGVYSFPRRPVEMAGRAATGLLPGSPDGHPLVALTVPVHDSAGASVGVLGGVIDLSGPPIAGFVEPLALGRTGIAQIVDGEGNVLVDSRPDVGVGPSEHGARFSALIKAGKAEVGQCHGCHQSGTDVEKRQDLLAFAPLSVANWGVALRQPEEEVMAPVRDMQLRFLLFGAAALALALVLAWVTTQAVVRPLRVLTEASERMAAGHLDEPIPAFGQDEVGRLARTFDDMRARLLSSLQEIQEWNHELEGRVQERTKALRQRAAESMALYQIGTEVSSLAPLDHVLSTIVEKARDLLGTDTAYLALKDDERQEIYMRVTLGVHSQALKEMRLRYGQGAGGLVVLEGKTLVVTDYDSDPRLREPVKAIARGEGLCSTVVAPLIVGGRVIGVLYVANRRPTQFAGREAELLSALATHAAIAIENARLFEEAGKVEALRELDRLKSSLLSTVSHELRTPLASIKGLATALLLRGVSRDERTQRRYLVSIDEETDRLCGLIDDLLDMSKIEAGALRLDKREVSLPWLAQRACESVPPPRRRRLQVAFPEGFPLVLGDERRLEQVMRNLLENALKYAPRGPIVVVGEAQEGEVVVKVVDHGAGIPQQDLDRVFEPFYRGENGAAKRPGGTGLGLAICRGIVQAHGGRIWAESRGGKGTTLFFALPTNHVTNHDGSHA